MKEKSINTNGVTLVEMMIAIVLGLILSTIAYMAYNTHGKSAIYQQEVTSIQQDLRVAMNMIETDVKNAGADPARSGNFTNFNDYMPGGQLIDHTRGYDFQNVISVQFDIKHLVDPGPPPVYDSTPDGDSLDEEERVLYYTNSNNQLLRLTNDQGYVWKKGWTYPNPLEGVLLANSMGLAVSYTIGDEFVGSPYDNIKTVTVTLTKTGSRNDPDSGKPIKRILSRTIMVRNYGTK